MNWMTVAVALSAVAIVFGAAILGSFGVEISDARLDWLLAFLTGGTAGAAAGYATGRRA